MSEIAAGFTPGAVVVIDGRTWTLHRIEGNAGIAHGETGSPIAFDAREVRPMGGGLFCLPGRTEPSAVNPQASLVAETAVSGMNGR